MLNLEINPDRLFKYPKKSNLGMHFCLVEWHLLVSIAITNFSFSQSKRRVRMAVPADTNYQLQMLWEKNQDSMKHIHKNLMDQKCNWPNLDSMTGK